MQAPIWAFGAFAGTSLRQVMLVHDAGNPASCRVTEKAGYPFGELSPASPPHWLTDGHVHMPPTLSKARRYRSGQAPPADPPSAP